MNTSEWIALFALIISGVSLLLTYMNHKRQSKFIKIQEELNLTLLEKEKKIINEKQKADISGNIIKYGSGSYRIKYYNKGNCSAKNVTVEYPENHGWLLRDKIFSIELMESGQSVEIPLTLTACSERKTKIIIKWIDDNSDSNQKEMYLTV
jgi:hypothetical protein